MLIRAAALAMGIGAIGLAARRWLPIPRMAAQQRRGVTGKARLCKSTGQELGFKDPSPKHRHPHRCLRQSNWGQGSAGSRSGTGAHAHQSAAGDLGGWGVGGLSVNKGIRAIRGRMGA